MTDLFLPSRSLLGGDISCPGLEGTVGYLRPHIQSLALKAYSLCQYLNGLNLMEYHFNPTTEAIIR